MASACGKTGTLKCLSSSLDGGDRVRQVAQPGGQLAGNESAERSYADTGGEHQAESEWPLLLCGQAGDGGRETDRPGTKGHAGQDSEHELCGLGDKADAQQGKHYRARKTGYERCTDAEALSADAGGDGPQYAAKRHQATDESQRAFGKVEAEQVEVKKKKEDREPKAVEQRGSVEEPELSARRVRQTDHVGLTGVRARRLRQSIACRRSW